MIRRYSRLARTESSRNVKRAFLYVFLTITTIIALIFLGIPLLVKITGFLTDLRQSSQPVTTSDTTPPVQPQFDPLPETTNQKSIDIKGSTEPGAQVFILFNNKETEILANNQGVFTYTFNLVEGINTISAKAKDGSGNESTQTETSRISFDILPPELAINKPADGASFFGSKQRQIIIEGQTEDGAKVTINDRIVVVESDGKFSFATSLSDGANSFSIKAADKAGNTTESSLNLSFTP